MDQWEYLEGAEFYASFDPLWDETLDWIIMLPEINEEV